MLVPEHEECVNGSGSQASIAIAGGDVIDNRGAHIVLYTHLSIRFEINIAVENYYHSIESKETKRNGNG